ncbi:hypothetical protein NC652_022263 [Populus alba x Populus x berolinensis]|nr:hypothetical protein NC652_022263 [Populus alba x Populus x berolinensis]
MGFCQNSMWSSSLSPLPFNTTALPAKPACLCVGTCPAAADIVRVFLPL